MKFWHAVIPLLLSFGLLSCTANVAVVKNESSGKPYSVNGKTYVPLKKVAAGHVQKGTASWYGPGFHGRKTSSGEKYDMYSMTAAHNVLPMNTVVKVTNLVNNKEVVVRINDRGPFIDDRTVPVRLAVLESRDTTKSNQYLAATPKSKPIRAPNPFYAQASTSLLALSRN